MTLRALYNLMTMNPSRLGTAVTKLQLLRGNLEMMIGIIQF